MNDTLHSASRVHNHCLSKRFTLILFSLKVVEYLKEEITWSEKETRKWKGGKYLKKENICFAEEKERQEIFGEGKSLSDQDGGVKEGEGKYKE